MYYGYLLLNNCLELIFYFCFINGEECNFPFYFLCVANKLLLHIDNTVSLYNHHVIFNRFFKGCFKLTIICAFMRKMNCSDANITLFTIRIGIYI